MRPVKVGKNKGTIRSNFEMIADESDEEGEMHYRKQSPGPGAYQTLTSDFGLSKPLKPRPSSI